jgi:hypothetical protein
MKHMKMKLGRTTKKAVSRMMLLLLLGVLTAASAAAIEYEGIAIYHLNPSYFMYRGQPVLLLGGSDDDNLFNNTELLMPNLEKLQEIGGNYIRSTMSSRDEGNVWPFAQLPDGSFDLEAYNPEYWQRFNASLREAQAREIIVQLEVWATFDFYLESWENNPFNPANNVNYTAEESGLPTEVNNHPAERVQPFFLTVPELDNNQVVLRYQQRFVDALLAVAFRYDNVLYSMDNETRAPAEWAHYWGRYIKGRADRGKRPVFLTEMWNDIDLRGEEHARTYAHPEIFVFLDISQNNWQNGQTHYDRILWVRSILPEHGGMRPVTNVKVYGFHRGQAQLDAALNVNRWWQNIFAGSASTRFHRPRHGLGLSEQAQTAIRAARAFTGQFNIFQTAPRPDLVRASGESRAYLLANPGSVYAVYMPEGGRATLDLTEVQGRYRMRWFDPETAEFSPVTAEQQVTAEVDLVAPGGNSPRLVLVEVLP